jgi:hypothetical protein
MKSALKQFLGEIPLTAEVYWHLRQRGKPTGGFSFRKFQAALPAFYAQAAASPLRNKPGKHVLLFATLRYWIEHAALLGLSLAGMGHKVTLAYLPYSHWQKPLSRFDLRRQNTYIQHIFKDTSPLMQAVSFLDFSQEQPFKIDGAENEITNIPLPDELRQSIEAIALEDTQYIQQMENIDRNGKLYRLRLERNTQAAQAALCWMSKDRPDIVIIPSGSILEFGAVFHVARHLGIPAVTYEFGEQRRRIWFGLNTKIMRQETQEMWAVYQDRSLTEEQWERVRALYASRQSASLWENFSRRWQGAPGEGGEKVRASLGLNWRPVVLLAANVIGDSLTLGRQVFTENMTDWLVRATLALTQRPDIQLVLRVHPGERYTTGPSVAQVVGQAFAKSPQWAELVGGEQAFPENIHLIPADAMVNTYDLMQIADLGLVYTTTVGLETAMSGVPVIVAGQTHYRGKGFTLDPNSWDEFIKMLTDILTDPARYRLSRQQVESAWSYAYRFFFDFPMPFPWHLLHFWEDINEWPMRRVLSDEGQTQFAATFSSLVGEPRHWK